MDLSRDEEGATQDRSNAPITTTHDPEQVSETKCCCFFKRKMRKKKSGRSKWPPGFGKIQKFLSRGSRGEDASNSPKLGPKRPKRCEELNLLKSDKSENVSGESKV